MELIILFPKIADHKIVNTASYSYFQEILEAGGKVYLYNKGFLHSKVIIIDDIMASIGSANMDLRSFKLNFEVNAFIYDDEVIKDMKNGRTFVPGDIKSIVNITKEMIENQNLRENYSRNEYVI